MGLGVLDEKRVGGILSFLGDVDGYTWV